MDLAQVLPLLEHAARNCMLPRYSRLADSHIEEKSPGELVTIADREVEEYLSAELRKLVPGSHVVGEEACAADPTLVQKLCADKCWVIDPLDGTSNFIAGWKEFGTLLAYLEHGRCRASWIYQPISGRCFRAADGAGAAIDGERLRTSAPRHEQLRGIVKTRFLPAALRDEVVQRAEGRLSAMLPGVGCTAFEYPMVAQGEVDFVLYWRTLAWDHVPCVHFLTAAGGHCRRIDGTVYDPMDGRHGLLVARDEGTWNRARAILFG